MANPPDQNITLLDVALARAYLPLLIELAKRKETCSYSSLVARAKEAHPDNADVQNAIPISAGRRLEVIRMYCRNESLPDLASLVVGKHSRECGSFYTRHFDPVAARAEVFAHDWSCQLADIDGYFDHTAKKLLPTRTRREPEARKLMAEFYASNRSTLPRAIASQREVIIRMLMEGREPAAAFTEATELLNETLD